jgi:hypothetical protein
MIRHSTTLENLRVDDQSRHNEGVMTHDLRGQKPQRWIDDQDDRKEEVLATIPQTPGDMIIEVAMIHTATGTTAVELRSLVWGNGLGWYRQHTLQLDGTTARELIQALGIVQRRVEREAVESLSHKVLPFPDRHQSRVATA